MSESILSTFPLSSLANSLLELGKLIHSRGGEGAFRPVSKSSPVIDEAALITTIKAIPDAKKLISFKDGEADIMEIRVLALGSFMGLMLDYHPNVRQISEVIGKESPAETMRVRLALKNLITRQVIRFRNGNDKPWNGVVFLSKPTLVTLGFVTPHSPLFSEKSLGIQQGAQKDAEGEDLCKNVPKGYIPPAEVIYTHIRLTVLGSYLEEPIRSISAMYNMHMHRASLIRRGKHPKTPNIVGLLIGSSSVGKTYLAETAAKVVNEVCSETVVPFSSVSATDITAEGFVGLGMEDVIRPLIEQCAGNAAKARYGCCFIDEWDKKACRVGRGGLDVGGRSVQESLLRILGGCVFPIGGRRNTMEQQISFNSDGTMVFLAGAFVGLDELMGKGGTNKIGFGSGGDSKKASRLRDCLIEYGMIPELVSRVGSIIIFPVPLLKDMVEICAAPRGLLDCYGRLWAGMEMKVAIGSDGVRAMADYGIETASYSRGMQSVLNRITEKLVFDGAAGKIRLGAKDINKIIDSMGVGG